MRKTSKIIITVIIVAVLLIGVGYAAIQNITLNIAGTAQADPSQSNFKVMFSGTPAVSDEEKVAAAITDDINATINVTGLTEKGESVTATYTVQNASTDISADLSVATTNSNPEYFTIKSELAKTSLIAGEATTLTVTVELTKIPVTESVSATIGVQITAKPVQPGEEIPDAELSGNTTLSSVTNADIGKYIDLGNDIIDYNGTTGVTTDDWRILYVEGNTVYAILSSYLPNSTNYASNAGLVTKDSGTELTYSVRSTTNRDDFIAKLTDDTAWNGLANGITGATVTGAITGDFLMKSYNEENGTSLDYTSSPNLKNECTTGDYSLYIPHTTSLDNCEGYWLVSPDDGNSGWLWNVNYNGACGANRISPHHLWHSPCSFSTNYYCGNKIR